MFLISCQLSFLWVITFQTQFKTVDRFLWHSKSCKQGFPHNICQTYWTAFTLLGGPRGFRTWRQIGKDASALQIMLKTQSKMPQKSCISGPPFYSRQFPRVNVICLLLCETLNLKMVTYYHGGAVGRRVESFISNPYRTHAPSLTWLLLWRRQT